MIKMLVCNISIIATFTLSFCSLLLQPFESRLTNAGSAAEFAELRDRST